MGDIYLCQVISMLFWAWLAFKGIIIGIHSSYVYIYPAWTFVPFIYPLFIYLSTDGYC